MTAGQIRLCCLSFVTVTASMACSSNAPTTPIAPSTQVDGVWIGTYHVTSCLTTCLANPDTAHSFIVRLKHQDQLAFGTVQTDRVMVRTSGTISPQQLVAMEGTQLSVDGSMPFRLTVSLQLAGGSARGSATVEFSIPPGFQPQGPVSRETYEIIQLFRAASDPTMDPHSFAGTWRGTISDRVCPSGQAGCGFPSLGVGTFEMTLSQRDTVVSGTVHVFGPTPASLISVSGTVSGGSLSLQGDASAADGRDVVRITSWNTVHDLYGELQSGFSYVEEIRDLDGAIVSSTLHAVTFTGVSIQP